VDERAVTKAPRHPLKRTTLCTNEGRRFRPMAKRFLVAPIAVVFVLALAGCGHGLGATGSSVSLDQEWQLGDQMAAQVAQQVHFVNDPVASNYVRAVGERIHAQTP